MAGRCVVLIVGHGSPDRAANAEFERLVAQFQAKRSEIDVRHGYLEFAKPRLADALVDAARTASEITLLPLFLFAAGHMKRDIPSAMETARCQFPQVRLIAARELGVHPELVNLVVHRARSAMARADSQRITAVLVGRGSSDAAATAAFFEVAQRVAAAGRYREVMPAFIDLAEPRFADALAAAAARRAQRVLVLPYFLFGGRLVARIQDEAARFAARQPTIEVAVAQHLGCDERLLAVIDQRLAEVRPH